MLRCAVQSIFGKTSGDLTCTSLESVLYFRKNANTNHYYVYFYVIMHIIDRHAHVHITSSLYSYFASIKTRKDFCLLCFGLGYYFSVPIIIQNTYVSLLRLDCRVSVI